MSEYNFGLDKSFKYDYTKKDECIQQHVKYMLNRTQTMFKWGGLPDTISQRDLELLVQTEGYGNFIEHNGKFYCISGALGGEPTPNLMPTIDTIANASLNFSKTFTIDKDVVVIPNDSMYLGLIPLNTKYATALVENELSLIIANINTRIVSLITAESDSGKASADEYIKKIVNGELSVVASKSIIDEGIKTQPYSNSTHAIKDLIENEQYLKASWFNEIGLNANYNMKREALNSSESALNDDILAPLVDDMLNNRKKAVEKINKLFGLNLTVELDGAWKDNKRELEIELKKSEEVKKDNEEVEESEVKE